MTITKDDLNLCHMRNTFHAHGDGFFMYGFKCDEHPRLSRIDRYEKKDRSVTSTFAIDGVNVADYDEAVNKLNAPVVLTDEERTMLDEVPVDWTRFDNRSVFAEKWRSLTAKGFVEWDRGRVRRRTQT